jgi:hypothetical protein
VLKGEVEASLKEAVKRVGEVEREEGKGIEMGQKR